MLSPNACAITITMAIRLTRPAMSSARPFMLSCVFSAFSSSSFKDSSSSASSAALERSATSFMVSRADLRILPSEPIEEMIPGALNSTVSGTSTFSPPRSSNVSLKDFIVSALISTFAVKIVPKLMMTIASMIARATIL